MRPNYSVRPHFIPSTQRHGVEKLDDAIVGQLENSKADDLKLVKFHLGNRGFAVEVAHPLEILFL
jgi:chemotaxis signal transduction protein